MNKFKLLLITPLLIGGVSGQASASIINSTQTDIEISSAVTSNTSLYLKGNYQLTTSFKANYQLPVQTIDQIGPEKRVSRLYYQNVLISEESIIKTPTGGSAKEYYTIDNKVVSTALVDQNENAVPFDVNFGNPLKNLANLSNSQINSYFEIEQVDSTYVLSANDLAYGALTRTMINFFNDLSSQVWDFNTKVEEIEDLEIVLDDYGEPISMSFTRVTKDRFGAIRNDFTSTFEKIADVETLKPIEPKMTEEQENEFVTKINAFQEKLNGGNFTQTFDILNGQLVYSNFYAINLDNPSILGPMMLSNLELYDASYGKTYVGLITTYQGYQRYAISPDANYSATMSDDLYDNINLVIPNVNLISPDFFSYINGNYVFDMTTFLHANTSFCASLLKALFSEMDPGVSIAGIYIDNYDYSFNSLSLSFDENDNLEGALSFNYFGASLESKFSYSNIGTTDLESEKSLEVVVEYLKRN